MFLLRCLLGGGMAMGIAAQPISAAVVAHEDFDYTVGAGLTGKNNHASEWGGSWGSADPQPFVIGEGSLTDPTGTLTTSGNRAFLNIWETDPSRGGAHGRNLSSAAISVLNGDQTGNAPDAWISFLVRQEIQTGHSGTISFGNAVPAQPGFSIGARVDAQGEGTWQSWMANDPSFLNTLVSVEHGEAALIVARMGFTPGTSNVALTLWVNPTPGLAAPDSAGATANIAKPFGSNGTFSIAGRAWSFDELRFGGSYADVTPVPEPAALALVGLAVPALLRRRRG